MKAGIIVVFLTIMAVCPVMSQQALVYEDHPKINVNGEAVIYVKPDKIIVSLGIETWDQDVMIAKRKNNEILVKAMAAIKGSGIPEKEIQTDHLSIQPRYKDDYRKEDFIGYFVRNTLVVTLAETNKVEDLITEVLQAGVNYIHGVDFETTEFKKYREQARELALKAAKEKAENMAIVLGQSVGAPVQISENYGGAYYSNWSGWGYSRGMGATQNTVQDFRGGSSEISDTIALGKIAIRANVAVVFELKRN